MQVWWSKVNFSNSYLTNCKANVVPMFWRTTQHCLSMDMEVSAFQLECIVELYSTRLLSLLRRAYRLVLLVTSLISQINTYGTHHQFPYCYHLYLFCSHDRHGIYVCGWHIEHIKCIELPQPMANHSHGNLICSIWEIVHSTDTNTSSSACHAPASPFSGRLCWNCCCCSSHCPHCTFLNLFSKTDSHAHYLMGIYQHLSLLSQSSESKDSIKRIQVQQVVAL